MIRTLVAFLAGGLVVAVVIFGQRFTKEMPESEFASEEANQAAAEWYEIMVPHLVTLANNLQIVQQFIQRFFRMSNGNK